MLIFIKKYKRAFYIVGILAILLMVLLPPLLFVDAVGIGYSGKMGEMAAWFDLLVGFVVTFGGFFFAMQFDDIFEKRVDAEKEAWIWSEIEKSLKEMRKRLPYNTLIWFINQCDSLLKLCEIDSTAIFATRKSPFYEKLLFLLMQLKSLPLEKYDYVYFTFKKLSDEYKGEMDSEKIRIIEAIFMWAIYLLLFDSINFNDYKLFQDDKISKAILAEFNDSFNVQEKEAAGCKYYDAIESKKTKGIDDINILIGIINFNENEISEIKTFCKFLVFSEEENKKNRRARQKKKLIMRKIDRIEMDKRSHGTRPIHLNLI